MDVTGDRSKVRRWGVQYCIEICNVRSMNQSKLEVVKHEMTRVKVNILEVGEIWIRMDGFNSDSLCIYYCGQE